MKPSGNEPVVNDLFTSVVMRGSTSARQHFSSHVEIGSSSHDLLGPTYYPTYFFFSCWLKNIDRLLILELLVVGTIWLSKMQLTSNE